MRFLMAAAVAAGVAAATWSSKDDRRMEAREESASGQILVTEDGKPALRYNYRTIEPGDLLSKVSEANRIYARARANYIHPLYGPEGEELTFDWPIDHPHHRGIYWAWPEVDYRGERGDLHALQRVFARPTGVCRLRSERDFAEIQAENNWRWEDREPIVMERARIRVHRSDPRGRLVDLSFRFEAVGDDVALARRGTDKYGGLNLRMAAVKDQKIEFHTESADSVPRMAWADLSGVFAGGRSPCGVTIIPKPTNPHYPGDWVQFPELNWFQPTFPASGARWTLKKGQPLSLEYRLWIHRGGTPDAAELAAQWRAYNRGRKR